MSTITLKDDSVVLEKKAKAIIVIPINMVKYNLALNAMAKEAVLNGKLTMSEGEILEVQGSLAIIKGTKISLDTECVGTNEETLEFSVYSNTKTADGKESFGIFPRLSLKQSVTELLTDFSMPEQNLFEFMGDRFAYNYRIKVNMNELFKAIKKK